MIELLPFFLVLFASIFFSAIFNRLHLPWVVALILGGLVIGPSGFDIFTPDSATSLLSDIGLIFLMFMAGLEMRVPYFLKSYRRVSGVAFINGIIPFIVGISVGILFGLPFFSSVLLGIIFVSSSVAVAVPALESNHLLSSNVGRMIISSTMVQDTVSLLGFTILLHYAQFGSVERFVWFLPLLAVILVALRWIIPKIQLFFLKNTQEADAKEDQHEQDIRSVFVILIGTVVLFELIGLHPIIAGFFAGFVLSDAIRSRVLREKLHTISYGIFIPIFFIVLGAETDIYSLSNIHSFFPLALAVIAGSLIAKFVSGYVAGRVYSFVPSESRLIGYASMAQLSTSLAVAFTGRELGLISDELIVVLIGLSIVSTLATPFLIYRAVRGVSGKRAQHVAHTTQNKV